MNNKKIIFTDTIGIEKEYYPKPASEYLPDWYKNTQSYIGEKKEILSDAGLTQTIKKCIPFFDAMTTGYIIPTYVDVYVRNDNGEPYYSWAHYDAISFHSKKQIENHPYGKNFSEVPKWRNPWSIKLPSGYSALFVPPFHQHNDIFKVLDGIVDCDEYSAPINFPFLLNDKSFEGLIPAGTPMVQVIPFKREKWKMEIGGSKEIEESIKIHNRINHKFFDKYKTMFWSRKEYK